MDYLDEVVYKVSVLAHHLHVLHQDLDSREDHSSIGMSQSGRDSLTDTLSLAVILGVVAGERVQDEDLAPLGALIESREQLVDGGRVHLNERLSSAAALVDL